MIQIKPEINMHHKCPCGVAEIQPNSLHLTGMHTMCKISCKHCSMEYFLEVPINAGAFYPGILDAQTGIRVDELPFDNWYLRSLKDAYKNKKNVEFDFNIEKNREFDPNKKVALLHCLDITYGHALFELFNAQYYLERGDVDLVIIVQRNLRWLVPDGAAEVWVLDLPFSRANDWNEWLANRVQLELNRLPEQVFMCRTFVQADSSDYDIERFSKVMPFPFDEWDERLEKPTVTIIWRNDRFWRRVLPKWLDNRILRKIAPKTIEKIRHMAQLNWLLKFAEALHLAIPKLDLAISGMDSRKLKIPAWIKDFRFPIHEDDTARHQCLRFAESHLVMGCNGSSLILPGCHAGSVLNIVPGDQWSVSAGSFAFRKTDFGDTHYRYTMVPAEITINRLVSITVAMLRDRSYIQMQTSPPWRDHDASLPPFALSEKRLQVHELGRHFASEAGLVTLRAKK